MNENRGPSVRKDPITVVNKTDIGLDSGTLARCEIDLGEHPPAALLHCIVTIRNVGDRMLRFSRVESGCACLSVAPAKGEISSGESLTFRVQIEAVQRPTRVVQTATFTCHDDAIPSMSVKLRYGLTGVVGYFAIGRASYKPDAPRRRSNSATRRLLHGDASGLEVSLSDHL
ncbi:DUF1573 domain-containing protein [Crateriforma conspicua]